MSDLLAKCDWHGDELRVELPQWPEVVSVWVNGKAMPYVPVVNDSKCDTCEATLGRGTCKVEGSIDYGEFGCWQYDLSCGCRILWPDSEPPTFCPECGRKVEP